MRLLASAPRLPLGLFRRPFGCFSIDILQSFAATRYDSPGHGRWLVIPSMGMFSFLRSFLSLPREPRLRILLAIQPDARPPSCTSVT